MLWHYQLCSVHILIFLGTGVLSEASSEKEGFFGCLQSNKIHHHFNFPLSQNEVLIWHYF